MMPFGVLATIASSEESTIEARSATLSAAGIAAVDMLVLIPPLASAFNSSPAYAVMPSMGSSASGSNEFSQKTDLRWFPIESPILNGIAQISVPDWNM
jgi:hypothetical protein